ncbi:hypothetical protein GWI33_016959 [Rhynchophorus ferrugineus]|uniref:Jumonji domain-containing protein 4 n=1 Tax=Rhynchophorus ferrugineus TaxID=354439 RepID=A0A834HXP7_RHYFE|nr:hypothetical protein GWI33_016959 [Rhynchophorus ferrugineus]
MDIQISSFIIVQKDYWHNKSDNSPIYYLKDWHLKLQCRNSPFYDVPIHFASDWLNEYFLQCLDDDYRFVYMGPKGSWTPLHIDVFSSYSWSVNVYGNKRWVFIPPNKEQNLKDNLNNLIYNIDDISTFKDYIEVMQEPGDAIFVPTGWFHQVWNLQDTISINHNWINGCNIESVWHSLKQTLGNVEREIMDCKDMQNFEEHCQAMLKSLFGMDYYTFYNMIACIVHNRIAGLSDPSKRKLFHGYTIGINHILFDLKKCSEVLQMFVECDYIKKTSYFTEVKKDIYQIKEVLSNNT